jgi:hypothetical protein
VPMALAGPRTGRQGQQVDAELGEAGDVAKLLADAGAAWIVKRRRVERPNSGMRGCKLDLARHSVLPESDLVSEPGFLEQALALGVVIVAARV